MIARRETRRSSEAGIDLLAGDRETVALDAAGIAVDAREFLALAQSHGEAELA